MMTQNFLFFTTVSSLCLISSLMVVLTKNPLNSVLFLILSFCNISCILFLLELEYLPLVFLVIYVGAIAVLLIFVIMMLNIRLSVLRESSSQLTIIAIILGFNFLIQVFFIFQSELSTLFNVKDIKTLEFTSSMFEVFYPTIKIESQHAMKNLGILVYTQYYQLFLIASLILLLAMVGAIVLTLQRQFRGKKQNVAQQVLTSFEINLAA